MKLLLWVSLGALACAAFASSAPARADSTGAMVIGEFSHAALGALPEKWKLLTFPKVRNHTSYVLAADGDAIAVRAEARASASALVTDVRIDPHEYPIIRWRWKIENLIDRADLTRKNGDDYPARLYINFRDENAKLGFLERIEAAFYRNRYGQDPPTATINYVWDGKAAAGTVAPNAYTDRVRMFVVRSGAQAVGRWVEEERNLLEDYRAAFGKEPPAIVSVAIMTDTDNTGESVVAWYGDIAMRKQTEK